MQKRLILIGAIVLALAVGLLIANTLRNALGWQPITQTPAERETALSAHWRLLRPDTPGPHKAAILLSGCDGVHDNMDYWAEVMRAQGRAALILDSHAPRRLDKAQAWRAICAGQILPGSERAGDLAVALTALQAMPDIDTADVALLGASHGGWTVMEFLRLLGQPLPPPGLTAWPAPPAQLAAELGPTVLLYPYCGLLSGAEKGPWPPIPTLMLLGERDQITDPDDCMHMGETLIAQGADLTIKTYPGINHGFDQQERSALSPLKFNPEARAEATRDVEGFIRGFASAAQGI